MKITNYMAIFQVICKYNLRIFILLEAIKKEHLVAADNHIYYMKNIFVYIR